MVTFIQELIADERGVASVEYAALLALITLAIVMAVLALGGAVGDEFTQAASELTSP